MDPKKIIRDYNLEGVFDNVSRAHFGGEPLSEEVRHRVAQDYHNTFGTLGVGPSDSIHELGRLRDKAAGEYAMHLEHHRRYHGGLDRGDLTPGGDKDFLGNKMRQGLADMRSTASAAVPPAPVAVPPAPVVAPPAPTAAAQKPKPPKKTLLQRIGLSKGRPEYGAEMEGYNLDMAEHQRVQAEQREMQAKQQFEAKKLEARGVADELHGVKGADGQRTGGKMQALKTAENELNTLGADASPATRKAAQQKLLGAQKDVLQAKQRLNTLARETGDLKQAHNSAQLASQEATHTVHRTLDPSLPEKAAAKLDGKPVGRSPEARLHDKRVALDVRGQDLEAASQKLAQAERELKKVNDKPNAGRNAAERDLHAAQTQHQGVSDRLSQLESQRSTALDTARDASQPHDQRIAAGKQAAAHKADIARLEAEQRKAQNALDKATKAHSKATAQEARAAGAVDAAHSATAHGKYSNNSKVITGTDGTHTHNHSRSAADRAAHNNAKANMADVHDFHGRTQMVAGPMGIMDTVPGSQHFTPRPDANTHAHPVAPTRRPSAAIPPAAAAHAPAHAPVSGAHPHAAPVHAPAAGAHVPTGGAHVPAGPSALRRGASASLSYTKDVLHDVKHAAKGGLKILALGGLAAGGLLAVSQMMKSPNPPRRLSAAPDFGDDPIAFNGGADVGLGSMNVPQIGQQAQVGNWAARTQAEVPGQGITRP